MSVLFTGGTGFVGKNVIPHLLKNYKIYAPNRSVCNLLSENEVSTLFKQVKPEIVVHCAGTVGGIGANMENPAMFFADNLKMGFNVIHHSFLSKVKKVILLGTVCSYPKFTPTPFKEEYLWNGFPEETNAPYGIAKRSLMEMLRAYNLQYNLDYTILIPTNMYGPHDHFNLNTSHVIPALIQKIVTAKENNLPKIEIWGTGNPSREFLYAEDLSYAIDRAINTKFLGHINIGTGIETKISDLVETLKNIVEFSGDIEYNYKYPDGQPRRCLNVERAKTILGFSYKTILQVGLEKTVRWYYDNIWNCN